ncbi:MAG TPA: hypothetical protein VHO03_11160 [Ignavibacteriales bacterium]|nr:hypothetical protein [Ignavibacteriales bacterium]
MRIFTLFTLYILFFFTGCAGPKSLVPCSTLSKSGSTEYFAPGLMDHAKLDPSWLKTEIKKEELKEWLLTYVKKDNEDILTNNSFSKAELEKINMTMFDSYNNSWNQIEGKTSSEDKIYYYTTPQEYWASLAGQEGLVVIRNCKILYVIILSQS